MIVTAEVLPNWSVRLTATSYTGQVDWFRVAGRDVPLGSGPVIEDRAAPLNQPVTYYATDDVSTVSSSPVTINATGPVLSSTMSNVAMLVTVVSFRPYAGEGRSVWHPVIGRSDPFVSVFPAMYPGGDLVIRAGTNDERVNLIQSLLQPGHPLLLRSTCLDRLDTMVFLMTSWSDPFAVDTMREGATHLTLSFQRVTEVTPAYVPPARSYQNMLDENSTYQVVLDDYATYQGLLDGVAL